MRRICITAAAGSKTGGRSPPLQSRVHGVGLACGHGFADDVGRFKGGSETRPYEVQGGHMQLTTTPTIEGKRIVTYCGVIAGEAILGANIFKDLFAGIRDIVGGRSATYERELQKAREIALQELQERAGALGANAVVGIDLDYEVIGQGGSMLMVSASGTAVVVE